MHQPTPRHHLADSAGRGKRPARRPRPAVREPVADLENAVAVALADCLAVAAECPDLTPDERQPLQATLKRLQRMLTVLHETMDESAAA